MKSLLVVFIFCSFFLASKASNPYRSYLLSKIYLEIKPVIYHSETTLQAVGPSALIPHYETPKGAIFCRMEDKVTRATKVWLKLGVQ
jgi:hypothetical protein